MNTFLCLHDSSVGDVSVIAVCNGRNGRNGHFEVGIRTSFALCLRPVLVLLLSSSWAKYASILSELYSVILYRLDLSVFSSSS